MKGSIEMIRQCCECKKIVGEKEPFEDKSITHTFCDSCFSVKMKMIQLGKVINDKWLS